MLERTFQAAWFPTLNDIEHRLFGRPLAELDAILSQSRRLSAVWDLVGRRWGDPTLTLEATARHSGLGRTQLNQRLKQKAGLTFHELLTRLRLWNAVLLMRDGELSLKEIADRTGFDEQVNFRRHFIKRLHQRPRVFRTQQWGVEVED